MQNSQQIRVVLVDDHLMTRMGLAMMLKESDGLIVVGEAESGEEAIALCGETLPDIILMDLIMPGMGGVRAIQTICEFYPQVRIIALSGYGKEEDVMQSLNVGAAGYLLKSVSSLELGTAIRTVAMGLDAISTGILQKLSHPHEATSVAHPSALTPRESEVLALLVEGLENSEIAARLCVSPTTVKSHVSNILSKLHVNSRTEAVAFAIRNQMAM